MDEQEFFNKIKELQKQRDLLKKDVTVLECKINEYKYFIIYNGDIYKVDHNWTTISNNIYFKNKKDAQAVIDNPNFRDILDAIYKN